MVSRTLRGDRVTTPSLRLRIVVHSAAGPSRRPGESSASRDATTSWGRRPGAGRQPCTAHRRPCRDLAGLQPRDEPLGASQRRLVPPGFAFATIVLAGRRCPAVPSSLLPSVCVDAPARLSLRFAHASGRPVPLTQDARHARNSGEFWKDHNLGRLAHRVEVPNEEHQRCLCERTHLVRQDS